MRSPTLACAAVLGLSTGGCWGSFFYHPTGLSPEDVQKLAEQPGWRLERLRVDEVVEVVGLVRPAPPGAPWLFYFGGNAMSLAHSQEVLEIAAAGREVGLAVWAYRGYDGSGGEPGEDELVHDAVLEARHLLSAYGVRPARLFFMGQSLGTGVASLCAAALFESGVELPGIILLSPYTSLADVVDDKAFFLGATVSDEFPSAEALEKLRAPVLLVHGVQDNVISVAHSRELAERLGPRATLVEVNRGHNDLWKDPSPALEPLWRFVDSVVGE